VPAFGQTATLFENVRVFDSANAVLTEPQNELVTGNTIAVVSPEPISPEAWLQVATIAGEGRVLMPGLIDAHAHLTFYTIPFTDSRAPIPIT
jgi:imidazolonepropionase-like amidohydrolase